MQPHIAYVTLVGNCTERALQAAADSIRTALPSLLTSFKSLAESENSQEWRAFMETLAKREDACESSEAATWSGNLDKQEVDCQAEDFDPPWGGLSFLPQLRGLLDAYFSASDGKDSIATRIRNAVHLLAEADRQNNDGLGLALSITAMEALLCKKDAEIGRMLAENVANLFEPALNQRFKAIEFMRRLYGHRSSVFHGSKTVLGSKERQEARLMAAAVLKALVDRQTFLRRLKEHKDETADQLFKSLEEHRYSEGPFPGVPLAPVNHLWRTPTE